jgi:hypothetical protein
LQKSVTRRLNEWRNDQWSTTHEFLDPEDQSLWRMTKRVMRFSTPSPPGTPGGITFPDSEKAEVFANNLETQFQPVANPSVPAVIEVVDVALRYYFYTPFTNTDEVHEAIGVSKTVMLLAQTVYRTEPRSIPSKRYPSSFRSSTQFSSPITFLPCGSTLG